MKYDYGLYGASSTLKKEADAHFRLPKYPKAVTKF